MPPPSVTTRARSSTSSSSGPSYLAVGRLGRAVGLKGEIELRVDSDAPGRFAPGAVVLAGDDRRPLTVAGHRRHRDRTIVSFEEVDGREAAEALRGADLVIDVAEARPLEPGEHWDHDLVGCVVVTTEGEEVGRVSDVLHTPANDVLVVEGDGSEHLVPLVADVVASIEPGRIGIVPLPGLLDEA